MFKFLVIQTAFIGDVVLATAIVEKLHQHFPDAPIDMLVRKGNESLLQQHPYINKVLIWDKKADKLPNLLRTITNVRNQHYTHVINTHRFASSGLITMLSGAKNRIGFDKNPFSFSYTKTVKHIITNPYQMPVVHETDRNQGLISDITDLHPALPRLYPTAEDFDYIHKYRSSEYVCISPASVWFTKQFPVIKWVELIKILEQRYTVYILGGKTDKNIANDILQGWSSRNVHDLCGNLSFLQSAALMQGAVMNYTNDSAPLHFASAMNAPVTAVYCSTVPAFGFGPLNSNGMIVEVMERLPCRPCGLHGRRECPEGHFKCAIDITNEQLLWWTTNKI